MKQCDLLFTNCCSPQWGCAFSGFGLKKAFQWKPPGVLTSVFAFSDQWKTQTMLFIPGILLLLCPQCKWICVLHNLTTCWAAFYTFIVIWDVQILSAIVQQQQVPNFALIQTADLLMLNTKHCSALQFPLSHILNVQSAWESWSYFTESMSKWHITNVEWLSNTSLFLTAVSCLLMMPNVGSFSWCDKVMFKWILFNFL